MAASRAADSVQSLVVYLGLLDADFTVREPPELIAQLRVLAGRYQRAVLALRLRGPHPPPQPPSPSAPTTPGNPS